ncbi:hypothetical protein D7V80_32680, partial [Corallococcus sp. CA054B]
MRSRPRRAGRRRPSPPRKRPWRPPTAASLRARAARTPSTRRPCTTSWTPCARRGPACARPWHAAKAVPKGSRTPSRCWPRPSLSPRPSPA